MMRMKWARRAFLKYIHDSRYNAAIRIQKYLKGYLIHKKWKDVLHDAVISRLSAHFRELKLKLHTDSQIKIRFAWRLHRRRKLLKKAKKKKQESGVKVKKGKKMRDSVGGLLQKQVSQLAEAIPQPRATIKKRSPKQGVPAT